MGLDMYLEKRVHVKTWNFTQESERFEVTVTRGGQPFGGGLKATDITYEVAYWRKANHIHRWFVDHVQGGADDCGEYYVSRKQLQELLDACKRVVEVTKVGPGKVYAGTTYNAVNPNGLVHWDDGEVVLNPEEVAAILPTAGGFFFGSTDYDQWYVRNVRDTITMVEAGLASEDEGEFYYHSSW